MNPEIIVFIPARFGSTRFPGKPLALISGKAMVLHVYEKAKSVFENVFVATDDQRITDTVTKAGGQAILTADFHTTGTERCAEAIHNINMNATQDSIILNIQGDEPFIPVELLQQLVKVFDDKSIEIATCVHGINDQNSIEDPNRVKVVMDKNNKAMYFSRSVIPFTNTKSENTFQYYQHIGIYAYRLRSLQKIVELEPSPLELKESLEQLRWLENGLKIHCLKTDYDGFGIDTEEDLQNALIKFKL